MSLPEVHVDLIALTREGMKMARKFFARRGKGTNVEVHLSETELAAALAHIGLEIEVAPGHVRRYAVREKTRWDRAFITWRKGLGRLLQGARL